MHLVKVANPLTLLSEIKESLLHLAFPHICSGCGNDMLSRESMLCMRCLETMPETNFELYPDNPVEKKFWGRLHLAAAAAQFYFTTNSLIQELMHQLKYRGNRELGIQLGRIMGQRILRSNRFPVEALIPLPLFPERERKRGYNQAALLCEGIAETLKIPVYHHVVSRPRHTATQTKKGKIERWKNIEGRFQLIDANAIRDKHIMLVDDVVTTGATLESCGTELLKAVNVQLSFGVLCYAL
jgi:ComF family protein